MSDERGGPERRLFRLGHRRPRSRDDVRWEIEHYVAERTDRLVEEGWDPEEARREAERRFGPTHRPRMERIERRRRMMTGVERIRSLVSEGVSNGWRTIRRSPGFAGAVVLTLALGIGANAAMFGIVDRLLLTPPAHLEDPDELRVVELTRGTRTQSSLTYPDFADLRTHRGLSGVGAFGYPSSLTRGSGADAEDIRGRKVSHDFFATLGVSPKLGRFFDEEEDLPGAPGTVVLSEEYWREAFGASPDALGRTIRISGRPTTVIGVAPAGFTGVTLDRVDVWLPLEQAHAAALGTESWKTSRNWWWLNAVVRVAEGRTPAAAAEEATRIHRTARSEGIDTLYTRTGLELEPLISAGGNPDAARVVRWLAGVSLLVLLIACANVANLLLTRGVKRRREVAVRLALGVSRARLVSERMLETVALAAVGGLVALGLAYEGGALMQRVLLPDVYFPDRGLNPRVLAFAAGISVLAGLLAGLVPALQSAKGDIADHLGASGRGSSGRRSRLRGALAVSQAALSVVLLVGAGLFVRSLQEVRQLDLGLDVDRVALATLELAADDLPPREVNDLYRKAARLLERDPAVESAAATSVTFQSALADRLSVPGLDSIPSLPGGGPYYYEVDPGYFETVGLEVLRGRALDDSDDEGGAPVTVVSRTMAEALWPDEGALGRCVMVGAAAEECTTVVGVVEDAARSGLQDDPYMAYYMPLAQRAEEVEGGGLGRGAANGLYLRAGGDPEEAVAVATRLLRSFDSRVRFARISTLRERLDPQARSWSLGATMFTIFGLLALAVASVGLYSLLAFEVAERTRELGIRTALGARRQELLRKVLVSGTRLAAGGVVAGLLVAWIAAPYAGPLLFETSPRDPWILTGVALVLLTVAAGASLVPALRATRVDPMVALRTE